ncbi:branched-chain amino acid transport system / permease component family protein [Paraburkholderia xenovorans LB400]|uniref:Amino acid/amide ABC transporter membrane protein 2, HAAT family n=1 Tax=Paraburkholderia xenovorans (strain LB400) TaxID=266265 RepID=Q13FM5_PARXL|nr:branched-chain amino acid ABC transporter permease [Paraburkholderia xenovorans]ABE37114.1 amino acid/amide ABC transporter membrane protein 2, HAAT family [Paraburkholderia xenovorans LB400]AIP34397.1 branched-chain amino acid transport system / permease component family protein [Paraburkholderia xenovorans LB400]
MMTARIIPRLQWAALVVAVVVPFVLSDYLTVFATKVLILSLLALSFDLVWGYAGILSFGQALFFGGGGYVAAVLARDYGVNAAIVALPAAILAGALLSAVVAGVVVLGKSATQIFIALGTMTASYAAYRLAISWYYLGGQNGISSLPLLKTGSYEFDEGPRFYYLALALLIVIYAVSRFLVRSQLGLALTGIRENVRRMVFLGYRVNVFKAAVFVFSGAIAGLAGGLTAFHEGFIGPGSLGTVLSTQAVLYSLLGGSGTLIGAVFGAVIIETLGFGLSDRLPELWPVLLGIILLLLIIYRPQGLISLIVSVRERTGAFGWLRGKPRR